MKRGPSEIRGVVKSILARVGLLSAARRVVGRDDSHGHSLLLRLLPTAVTPGSEGYFIEVGTTREKLPGQGSTVVLAELAQRLGLTFVTVDMDPANTEQARVDLRNFPSAKAVTAKGEDFLAESRAPIVAAYLDAFDIDHGAHSEYRIDRYRRYLSTEITNDAAQQMHLACAEALISRVVPGGVIVIDDTWSRGGSFAGKGATAVPLLLHSGYTIIGRTKTAIALQRATAA